MIAKTCRYAGLKGMTNGQLLSAAEESGFEVLITLDRNLAISESWESRGFDRRLPLHSR